MDREARAVAEWIPFRLHHEGRLQSLDRNAVFEMIKERAGNLLLIPGEDADDILVHQADQQRFIDALNALNLGDRILPLGGESQSAAEREEASDISPDAIPSFGRDRFYPKVPSEAHGAQTRTELRKALDSVRRKVSRRRATPVGGDIVFGEDGEMKVDSETMKRMVSKKSQEMKRVENEIRQELHRVAIPDGTVDKMLTVLLARSSDVTGKVQQEINSLTKRHGDLVVAIRRNVGIFQVEKFLVEKLGALMKEVESETSRKGRMITFRSFAKIFGRSPTFYNKLFEDKVGTLLAPPKETVGQQLDKAINSLVELEARIVAAHKLLDTASSERRVALKKQIEDHLNVIKTYPFVEKVNVHGTVFAAEIKDVRIVYARKIYNLGRYRIQLALDENHSEMPGWIVIYNLEFGSKGKGHHPHIRGGPGTSICWGNIGTGVRKLYADWNWPLLLQLIYNYLCSYNPADKYIEIDTLFSDVSRRSEIQPISGAQTRRKR